MVDTLSPQVTSTVMWFLRRWSRSYLLPDENYYSEVKVTYENYYSEVKVTYEKHYSEVKVTYEKHYSEVKVTYSFDTHFNLTTFELPIPVICFQWRVSETCLY